VSHNIGEFRIPASEQQTAGGLRAAGDFSIVEPNIWIPEAIMPPASAALRKAAVPVRVIAHEPDRSAWVVRQLRAPKPAFPRIAARAAAEPEIAAALAASIDAKPGPVRLGAAKALWLATQEAPEALYPLFDFFVSQLENPNSVVGWNAARALACLAPADRDSKLEAVLDKYLGPIPGPQMIAASNAIAWAPVIALAKPHLADRIARAIMGVRNAVYKTDECRNIAIGYAIQAFGRFFDVIPRQEPVVRFVRGQLENSRAATRRKAQEFLKRHAGWKRR